jgi:hypothetical protein
MLLTAAAFAMSAGSARAQDAVKEPAPLFFEGDMVRGPAGGGPVCVLASQFRRKESVVWRVRVRDRTGRSLDDKGLRSLVVELPDGQRVPMKFGPHPARGPATDFFWATSWVIPETYPTGSLAYKVTATDPEGRTQSWEPFRVGLSQLTVIP